MTIEIHRREKEAPQSLVRRFSRRIRKSGLLRRVRQAQWRGKSKSRQMKKIAALRREELKKEYQKLKKLGETKNDFKRRN